MSPDVKRVIYNILIDLKNGGTEPQAANYSISYEEFGDIVEMIQNDGLITGAAVQRAGQGNKIVFVMLNSAKITLKGLAYLDANDDSAQSEVEELNDQELEERVLSICYEFRGDRRKVTTSKIRKELPINVNKNRIEWTANNLIDKKYIRKVKSPSFKGYDGKTVQGDYYYEITPLGISFVNNGTGVSIDEKEQSNMSNKVFIIHGHDNAMKTEVQLLLTRAKLEDVVLHEQLDRGRTIIDKLIQESKEAVYVIALLSPDDILQNGSFRARQNVILEIGYFLGQLGKEKVRLLKKENVEMPSDLQGILYENYDQSGAWKMKLLKEMEATGIEIDFRSVMAKY